MPTKAELEATFRDVTDPGYADPLEHTEEGLGWDPVAAAAAIHARASEAITHNSEAFYLLPHSRQRDAPATGAVRAAGTVTARRTSEALPALTIPAAAPLRVLRRSSRGDWLELGDYELALPLSFAEGERQVTSVRVQSVRPGEQGNLPPGDVVGVLGRDDLVLEQTEPLTGGRHATLDAIGHERDMPRVAGEPDLDYAYRLSSLPDSVSPNTIQRIAAQILSPLGIRYEFYETRTHLPGVVLDWTPLDQGSIDPPRDRPWWGHVLLTEQATRRYFAIVVELDTNIGSSGGLPFDAINAGINAYDAAAALAEGQPVGLMRAIATLYQAIDAARMGGVQWELLGRPPFVRHTVNLTIACEPGDQAEARSLLAALYSHLAHGEAFTAAQITDALSEHFDAIASNVSREVPSAGGVLTLGAVTFTDLP